MDAPIHEWVLWEYANSAVYSMLDARSKVQYRPRKAGQPEELLIIPGASHFDLYDKSQYVTPAVDKMAEFFGKHL